MVGPDGRNSVVRSCSGLPVEDLGAPMDVLWMRLTKHKGDPELLTYSDRGRALILLNRGMYWQCGFSVPKGAAVELRAKSIENFRAEIAQLGSFLQDRVGDIRDWDDVKLLTVCVDRLRQCIAPACCASEMRLTPYRRWAASESILPFRMPSPQPIYWPDPLAGVPSTLGISRKYNAAANSPPGVTQRVQALIRKQVGGSLDASGPRRLCRALGLRIIRRVESTTTK